MEEIRGKHEQILKLQDEKERLEAEFKAAKKRLEARISVMEERHHEQARAVDNLQQQLETERKERGRMAVEQERKEQRLRRLEDNARAQEMVRQNNIREQNRLAAVRVELKEELRKEEPEPEPEVNGQNGDGLNSRPDFLLVSQSLERAILAKLVDRDCQSSRPLGCPVLEASTKETVIDYWEENLLDGTWRVVKYLFQYTDSEVIIMRVRCGKLARAKFQEAT